MWGARSERWAERPEKPAAGERRPHALRRGGPAADTGGPCPKLPGSVARPPWDAEPAAHVPPVLEPCRLTRLLAPDRESVMTLSGPGQVFSVNNQPFQTMGTGNDLPQRAQLRAQCLWLPGWSLSVFHTSVQPPHCRPNAQIRHHRALPPPPQSCALECNSQGLRADGGDGRCRSLVPLNVPGGGPRSGPTCGLSSGLELEAGVCPLVQPLG